MTKFCHIAPTNFLYLTQQHTHHLLLAHLVESDAKYRQYYSDLKKENPSYTFILDNSAFEMYKQGKPMYPGDRLMSLGKAVSADYIVMSDYPNEDKEKTIDACLELGPVFKQEGFGTFFVPQSKIGDLQEYIECFSWAASSILVDYIGVSILGVPNAFGVERGNTLQRFVSRWRMMGFLERLGILDTCWQNNKLIHFLGMVDGPNEISLIRERYYVDTWDSSAAIWCGLNDICFDTSPTGLINGKFEKEVDFNFESESRTLVNNAINNIIYIDKLCEERLQ